MVVPPWSPLRPVSAALAVLLLPAAMATPEVRDPSQATAFVDGASDFIELGFLFGPNPDRAWSVVSPDGERIVFTLADTGDNRASFFLDGSPRSGNTDKWQVQGSLDGAAADGTWTVASNQYNAVGLLSSQGRAVRFGVAYLSPQTDVQAWNWHMTDGTWTEPSTVPPASATTDPIAEGPEEDPQHARLFVPGREEVGHSIPGASESRTVPGQDVDTPPLTVPATCTLEPCAAETPLTTPAQPVPQACVPPSVPLLCVGPFTVPAQDLGDVPAACDVAGAICVGPIPVGPEDVAETPAVTVAVAFTGLDVQADSHAGELTSVGPFTQDVPVPVLGDVPVTVCPATCPFPVAPEGATLGSLTITVTVGAEQRSVTVPLDAPA